jgi:hypothetical protein
MEPAGKRFIYFMKPKGHLGPIKIGTARSPITRLKQIERSSPYRMEIIGAVIGTPRDESFLHRTLWPHHSHGEWFHPNEEVLSAVEKVIKFGIEHARKNFKDMTRCSVQAYHRPTKTMRQCQQRGGHGPRGEFCRIHAKSAPRPIESAVARLARMKATIRK